MSKDQTQELFDYIALLESNNQQLARTLRYCVELLAQFKSSVHDPEGWQKMLDELEKIIKAGERIDEEKTIH